MTGQVNAVAHRFRSLEGYPLRHGFSGRDATKPHEGDVGHARATDPASIESNREAFLRSVGICPRDLALGRQTHGPNVLRVTASDRGRGLYPEFDGFPDTDGLATSDPGVAVGVIVADCVPLLLYDPRQHAVAVVHAGWRGTVALIAARAVEHMAGQFGTSPSDIVAGIGPSIGPCCYEVGEEVIDRWRVASGVWGDAAVGCVNGSLRFDLWTANAAILERVGVAPERVEVSQVCVRCATDRYFSYRASRQNGAPHGRMMLVAQLDTPH